MIEQQETEVDRAQRRHVEFLMASDEDRKLIQKYHFSIEEAKAVSNMLQRGELAWPKD